jgi:hypothetical protein
LTVRDGAKVDREGYDDLDEAITAMRERAHAIRAEGPPKSASSLVRKFEPKDQVTARLELSGRGLLRKPVAGIDVRGDGTFTAYRGGLRREELDPSGHDTPFDLVRETLEGADR